MITLPSRTRVAALALLVVALGLSGSVGFVLADPFSSTEGVPRILAYEGYLEKDGIPATAPVMLSFRIFSAESGGTELWPLPVNNVTRTLTPQQGRFAVRLGDNSGGTLDPLLPASVFAGGDAWLQVTVDNAAAMPRQRLTSVPYALRAVEARSAETVDESAVRLLNVCSDIPGEIVDTTGMLTIPASTNQMVLPRRSVVTIAAHGGRISAPTAADMYVKIHVNGASGPTASLLSAPANGVYVPWSTSASMILAAGTYTFSVVIQQGAGITVSVRNMACLSATAIPVE